MQLSLYPHWWKFVPVNIKKMQLSLYPHYAHLYQRYKRCHCLYTYIMKICTSDLNDAIISITTLMKICTNDLKDAIISIPTLWKFVPVICNYHYTHIVKICTSDLKDAIISIPTLMKICTIDLNDAIISIPTLWTFVPVISKMSLSLYLH